MSEVVQAAPTETVEGDCPECDGDAVADGQETVCAECGLVLEENPIDHGPEWVHVDDEADKSRVGQPRSEMVHDSGIGSKVGKYRDGNGTVLDSDKRGRLARQRMYHSRARFESKRDRNRAHAFGEIHRICCALDIDDGRREQACRLFKQAQAADLLFGHSIEGMAAATIYAVARLNRDHLQRADVVEVARVGDRRIANAYDVMNRELGLPTPPPSPRQYLGRIVGQLDAGDACRRRAAKLLDAAEDLTTNGSKPAGVAAGAVYIAMRELADDPPTQAAVAEAAGVSTVTVRKRRDDLQEAIEA